ncbi:MAG: hypothetical protein AB1393_02805 [Candidatus Edwardsbacteria bacterium]
MEQKRFEDTILEKDYRLIDPLYASLQNYPAPKAEQGVYLETRYQISRKLTITKAYLDTWKNLAFGLLNLRLQGEIEYRPVFPLRIRLKEKWQIKHQPKEVVATASKTKESTLRCFANLSQWDNLNLELRYGQVIFTGIRKYDNNILMDGGYLSCDWEHHFSPRLSVKGGMATWRTDGMSQWIFEDTGIDFLNGQGSRYFITISDRFSPGLQLRLKFRGKFSRYPHSEIYTPDKKFYYENELGIPVRDFTNFEDLYTWSLQLDYRW